MNIFARFYFSAARLERERRENKCSAKMSTFTVFDEACVPLYHIANPQNDALWEGQGRKVDALWEAKGQQPHNCPSNNASFWK